MIVRSLLIPVCPALPPARCLIFLKDLFSGHLRSISHARATGVNAVLLDCKLLTNISAYWLVL